MMSSLTDRIFQTAFEALLNRDSELCNHVIAEDQEIDILEKQVDQGSRGRYCHIQWSNGGTKNAQTEAVGIVRSD